MDPYTVLGLPTGALPAEIRRAYREAALRHHPDRAAPADRAEAAERFRAAAEAYQVLSSQQPRADEGMSRRWRFRSSDEVFAEFFGGEPEAPAGMHRQSVANVSADKVFNLPLFEFHLVVDLRSPDRFAQGQIPSSLSLPAAAGLSAAQLERGLANHAATFGPTERASPAVLVVDQQCAHAAPELACLLRAREVWVVDYTEFSQRFGWICGSAHQLLTPTPHWIVPGLWLGSRAVPQSSWACLGITHAVVDRGQGTIVGIACCVCEVADSDRQPMGPCWDQAASFISEAIAAGGQVMVNLHGRSRSASVVVAWLMRKWLLPVRTAARVLADICPAIDWRLSFPDQLAADAAPKALGCNREQQELCAMAEMGLPTGFSHRFGPQVTNHEAFMLAADVPAINPTP